jgi:hypothetical protein
MGSELHRIAVQFLSIFWLGSPASGNTNESEDVAVAADETDTPAADEDLDPTRPPDVLADCEASLSTSEVRWERARIPLHASKTGQHMCGAPEVIRYQRGPGKIRYSSTPKLTCAMGVQLAEFESLLQDEANERFASRVYRIKHLGTYNCREMAAYPGWVSEHSYANAIDLASFTLANGTVISVLDHWSDPGPKGEFLRAVARRAYDEDVFSGVITPAFDALHRNHFHLDMAHYRVDGTR